MTIRRRPDSHLLLFLKRTVSAQIHFIGFIIAIVGAYFLLKKSLMSQDSKHFWGCLIYSLTSIIVFATSSAYHFLHDGFHISEKMKDWFEDMDHFSIYLFIAGTYTPFLINVVDEPWQTRMLILVWSIAFFGILYTHYRSKLPKWAQSRYVYTGIFVLMGWTLGVRIVEIIENMSSLETSFLMMGAMSYTTGALIYAVKRPILFPGIFGYHEIWHLAVLAGAIFHYFLIYEFYL